MRAIDMHCDTILEILMRRNRGEEISLRKNNLMIDLEKLKQGGYSVQNFALFVHLASCTEMGIAPFEMVSALIRTFKDEMEANKDLISQVYTVEDIKNNEAEGKLSALLTVEEGGSCEGKMKNLHALYNEGVRMLTLTWNFPNELGFPHKKAENTVYTPETELGLTETGIEFVREMERLGMIVDVSHLSDAGFWDVIKYTTKPFVASHSNARAVCPWTRNLTDDMIRALAEHGGVTGLNYCANFLRDHAGRESIDHDNSDYASIRDIAKHARHIVNVGGMECLGLGSDFDGIPLHPELHSAAEMYKLADELGKAGFTEDEVDKIFYGNVFRVYREVLK